MAALLEADPQTPGASPSEPPLFSNVHAVWTPALTLHAPSTRAPRSARIPDRPPITRVRLDRQAPMLDSDPDSVVVARVQQGDTEAFEHLVRRHGRRIHLTLAGILRRDQDVEDAVQDTFVSAFQHIGSFEGRSSFLTWLTRIAINTGLRMLRRRDTVSLDHSRDAVDGAPPVQIATSDDDPEQQYSRNAMRSLVWRAVMELPLKYRVVVMLRDLQQLSTAETAATLDLGTQAVKARLFRGRLMVRKALAPHVTP